MIKPQSLLISYPFTRINDRFVNDNSVIDFTPVTALRDPLISGKPNDKDTRFCAKFYKNIALDIVCETAFEYPYPFITEKTYRSIACLRPFIILGPYRVLEFIKSFEFETFSAILDESYDQIKDPEKRFLAVCNSIQQFVCRPIELIQQDIVGIESVLTHNRSVLKNLVKKETELFKSKIKNNDTN